MEFNSKLCGSDDFTPDAHNTEVSKLLTRDNQCRFIAHHAYRGFAHEWLIKGSKMLFEIQLFLSEDNNMGFPNKL